MIESKSIDTIVWLDNDLDFDKTLSNFCALHTNAHDDQTGSMPNYAFGVLAQVLRRG